MPQHGADAPYVMRILDHVKAERGVPTVIRIDNGPRFAGQMQDWAARDA